ncbi:MAG: ribose 5-phosphate isomerase B [Bacteroidales bacterium]|nr:ribose 5-phosphate isomerase B [Bacteroidales bacterium]MCK5337815.1 ribose 5-phosphate isomerase B [Bacteroidales bacterium]
MFDKQQKIPISCDHGGFDMKEFLRVKLEKLGYIINDMGTYSGDSVDYPDFIHPLAKAVNDGEFETGIILCGSGNGAQMTANKYSGVRAALCWTPEQAELARKHNNANIISLPGRFVSNDMAIEMALKFLNTEFEGGRHQRRVEKISKTL